MKYSTFNEDFLIKRRGKKIKKGRESCRRAANAEKGTSRSRWRRGRLRGTREEREEREDSRPGLNCVALSEQSRWRLTLTLLCSVFISFFWMCYRSRAIGLCSPNTHTHTHTHAHTHAHAKTLFPPTDYMHCEKVAVFVICMYKSEYQKYERNKDVELFLYVTHTEWL